MRVTYPKRGGRPQGVLPALDLTANNRRVERRRHVHIRVVPHTPPPQRQCHRNIKGAHGAFLGKGGRHTESGEGAVPVDQFTAAFVKVHSRSAV